MKKIKKVNYLNSQSLQLPMKIKNYKKYKLEKDVKRLEIVKYVMKDLLHKSN